MKKIFARMTGWDDYCDVASYFEGEEEAENFGLCVVPTDRHYSGYSSSFWKYLSENLSDIAYYMENVGTDDECYYPTASAVLDVFFADWTNGKKRSSRLIHEWKEAIKEADANGFEGNAAARLMTLYTGKTYTHGRITGCCQGDVAEIYFPSFGSNEKDEAYRKEIEAYYFGTGREVNIHAEEEEPNEPDEINGFWAYIPIPYASDEECKEYLAEYFGDKDTTADDVTLWIPTEKHTSVWYDYETA